eukprot:731566-Hanusia_phi.AAC.1
MTHGSAPNGVRWSRELAAGNLRPGTAARFSEASEVKTCRVTAAVPRATVGNPQPCDCDRHPANSEGVGNRRELNCPTRSGDIIRLPVPVRRRPQPLNRSEEVPRRVTTVYSDTVMYNCV